MMLCTVKYLLLQKEQRFTFAEGLNVSGLTSQVVEKIFAPMLECGRCYRQLEKFVDATSHEDGLIIKVSTIAFRLCMMV